MRKILEGLEGLSYPKITQSPRKINDKIFIEINASSVNKYLFIEKRYYNLFIKFFENIYRYKNKIKTNAFYLIFF